MFVELKDILFTDKGDNITQRLLGQCNDIMAGEMMFDKGSCVPPHSHPDHMQFIYIIKGKFEITCGTEKRILTPGDCLYADRNEVHGTLGLEDGSVLLDVHYPIRHDLLDDPRNRPAKETDRRMK